MSAQVAVRAMRRDDLDRVVAIASSLHNAPQWPVSAYQAALEASETPRRIALVAEDAESETVAGFAVASVVDFEAELESIAVAAQVQGRGVGTRLLAALLERLQAMGVKAIHLEVRAGNEAARRLYGAFRFTETGRRMRYYADPIEDAVLMRLRWD